MANEQAQAVARQALNLSYSDLKDAFPKAPEYIIKDLFNKQSNIDDIASLSDGQTDQIVTNTENIALNTQNLTDHIDDAEDAHDASAISYDNTASGLTATEAQGAIDEVDSDLDTHIALTTAHGVTGVNVGTEDFAQDLVGGVVLLAENVANAVASVVSVDSPDATDLPSVITLANELKTDVNQLVADFNSAVFQINAFLAANQTAKQMDP